MTGGRATESAVRIRVAIILGVALLLRCLYLTKESFWLDEIGTWFFINGSLHRALMPEPQNPPVYFVLLFFWTRLFGLGEAAIRSFNIAPSVFDVWLVYRLGARFFSRQVAYIAAAYQAISTFQIYYAQEARNYPWLVGFILLASWALWNAMESGSRRARIRYYALYSVLGALSLYTHFISVFFLAAHGLFVLVRRPKQLVAAGAAAGGTLLLFSPWLLTLMHAAALGGQARRYLFLKFPQAYFSLLFGDTLIPLDEQAVLHVGASLRANWWILALSLLSFTVLACYAWLAWKRWGEPMLYTATMCTVPVILAFLVSFKVMVFDERYMIAASPFLYLAMAAGCWEILRRREKPATPFSVRLGIGAIGAYCLLLLISLGNYYFNPRYGKEEWRQATAYIENASSHDGRDLVAYDPEYLHWCYDYYGKRSLPEWPMDAGSLKEVINSPEQFAKHIRGYRTVWLVRSHYLNDDILNLFRKYLPQVSCREFPKGKGIEVYAFDASHAR